MKAAVMRANNAPLELEEVRIDDPGPGEVLLKTAASGICHSDLTVIEVEEVNHAFDLMRTGEAARQMIVFKATDGCFTSMGPPAMPMLAMTTIGRRSGRPRTVQLACLERDGDTLVVASAMGQDRHPAWRYNIDADPRVEIPMRGERFSATARVLSDAEKDELWADIRHAIPQMKLCTKSEPTGTSACFV